jgi:RNA polymerase sigma-70 factor, ECF subfamily
VTETCLQTLVENHYARIYRAALMMTGSVWDADDLAQETFLQAMGGLGRFADNSRVDTWLYAILVNLHRRRIRGRARLWRRWRLWFARAPRQACDDSPDHRLLLEEWRQGLWRAVAELPTPQRYALVLRYSEGLAYREIAVVLGCPEGTVKSRLHHAVAALQEKLRGGGASDASPPRGSRLDNPFVEFNETISDPTHRTRNSYEAIDERTGSLHRS